MELADFAHEWVGESVYFPELLVAEQFLSDRLLTGDIAGDLALRWAVFADGLKQYWKMAADPARHGSEEFREEESWILADDRIWPFSFANLCETFGFQTESTRAALLAWKLAHLPEVARSHRLVPQA